MATLQKIRTKAGVLVTIIIGLSLGAFILSDMLQNGNTLFKRSKTQIADIDGEKIQYADFQGEVDQLAEIYKRNSQNKPVDENTLEQIREEIWSQTVEKALMGKVYDKLGIAVGSDELFDLVQGNNIHPIVQNIFRNPNTGQVDKAQILGFLKNLDSPQMPEENKNYWLYIEKQIVSDKTRSKYMNMLSKGLYATTSEIKNNIELKNRNVDFEYIALGLNTVKDSQVVVSDKELKAYYEKNKDLYKQSAQRTIDYITFPIVPSQADFHAGEKWINEIKPDFAATTDNAQFISTSSDESFDPSWHTKSTLPANIADWAFATETTVNSLFGPYFENETYKISKINAIEMQPDSVKARHILLQVKSEQEVKRVQALADSLKNVIDKGGDFATLAMLYSTDQGSKIRGGDLGWFKRNMMVKPFEDAAFSNKKNETKIAASQFGIHIIQTTDRGVESKHVQIATLAHKIVASSQTTSDIYSQASRFASANKTKAQFDAAVSSQKLDKKTATVTENQRQIPGFENARILIRAANETEKGEIIKAQDGSPIFEIDGNFIIGVLASVSSEGIEPFETAKRRVEINVINEKKKELLATRLKNAKEGKSDLSAIANSLGLTVMNASGVNFNTYQIATLGSEPALVGAVSTLEQGKITEPVLGNSGVYLAKVTSVNKGTDTDVAAEKMRLDQTNNYKVNTLAIDVRKKASEIVDKRAKFY